MCRDWCLGVYMDYLWQIRARPQCHAFLYDKNKLIITIHANSNIWLLKCAKSWSATIGCYLFLPWSCLPDEWHIYAPLPQPPFHINQPLQSKKFTSWYAYSHVLQSPKLYTTALTSNMKRQRHQCLPSSRANELFNCVEGRECNMSMLYTGWPKVELALSSRSVQRKT